MTHHWVLTGIRCVEDSDNDVIFCHLDMALAEDEAQSAAPLAIADGAETTRAQLEPRAGRELSSLRALRVHDRHTLGEGALLPRHRIRSGRVVLAISGISDRRRHRWTTSDRSSGNRTLHGGGWKPACALSARPMQFVLDADVHLMTHRTTSPIGVTGLEPAMPEGARATAGWGYQIPRHPVSGSTRRNEKPPGPGGAGGSVIASGETDQTGTAAPIEIGLEMRLGRQRR